MKKLILLFTLLAASLGAMEGQESKPAVPLSLIELCTQQLINNVDHLKTVGFLNTLIVIRPDIACNIIAALSDENIFEHLEFLKELLLTEDHSVKAAIVKRLRLSPNDAQALFDSVVDVSNTHPDKYILARALFGCYENLQSLDHAGILAYHNLESGQFALHLLNKIYKETTPSERERRKKQHTQNKPRTPNQKREEMLCLAKALKEFESDLGYHMNLILNSMRFIEASAQFNDDPMLVLQMAKK